MSEYRMEIESGEIASETRTEVLGKRYSTLGAECIRIDRDSWYGLYRADVSILNENQECRNYVRNFVFEKKDV